MNKDYKKWANDMLEFIARNEGWEESEKYYKKEFFKNKENEDIPDEIKEEIEALRMVCWTHSIEASEWLKKIIDYFS